MGGCGYVSTRIEDPIQEPLGLLHSQLAVDVLEVLQRGQRLLRLAVGKFQNNPRLD